MDGVARPKRPLHLRPLYLPTQERIEARVEMEPFSGCWIWTGSYRIAPQEKRKTLPERRYPYLYIGRKQYVAAHRASYELFVGPIPDGLTIDHLCRTTLCVNPLHLEPVTMRENVLRGTSFAAQNAKKTHCLRGHPYDKVRSGDGARYCSVCALDDSRKYESRHPERNTRRRGKAGPSC